MINAIIVAAGNSLRMNGNIKKQYIHINGIPLVCHSLKTFDSCKDIDVIYLVVPKVDLEMCRKLIVKPLKLKHQVHILSGGLTRQASVMNALEAINDSGGIVLIHDGVRPFVTKQLILKCLANSKKTGACIPAIPVTDSLKKVWNNNYSSSLERKNIYLAQTPQVFDFDLILRAHRVAKKKNLNSTDDSSIVENLGTTITIIQGNSYNIKITYKHDLILADAIAKII